VAVDPAGHRVEVNGRAVDLTATEYRLLEYLVRRAESIVSRDELADHVWGAEYDPDSNVADVYVGYLRRKLRAAGVSDEVIHTVRGLGYMLKDRRPDPS
jgi:DNA-binding response OmpR family regulator